MLTTILNVALMIFGFGLLIFVHELGHFLAARWAGIRAEAFAIGMGPVAFSYRKGIGWKLGSTAPEYEKRVRDFLKSDAVHSDKAATGKELTQSQFFAIGDKLGLGETEYSIRYLPIGGFVKMLGQEDANPNAVSDDPRSYGRCPVGKRMVVVSAGVIMNLILAVILFIWSFMIGVDFEAPVIGAVASHSPASDAKAVEAEKLGITRPGIQVNDTILAINDDTVITFADVKIDTAMARADEPLTFKVQRPGVNEVLTFNIQPLRNKGEGLLGVGVAPSQSTTLISTSQKQTLEKHLAKVGLDAAGVKPGMKLVSVNNTPVSVLSEVQQFIDASHGNPIETQWRAVDKQGEPVGDPISAQLEVHPDFSYFGDPDVSVDHGLLGLPMLMKVQDFQDDSPNKDVLKVGDVIIGCADVAYPRISQLQQVMKANAGKSVSLQVLRDGQRLNLTGQVERKGVLGINLESASDTLICAKPYDLDQHPSDFVGEPSHDDPTPVAPLNLFAGTKILAVNNQPVSTWSEFRAALLNAIKPDGQSTLTISLQPPQDNAPVEQHEITLTDADVRNLHSLGWSLAVSPEVFEPHYVTLTAGGNPLRAISMGINETRKSILGAYLTLDRLVRGTVGVDQLRGPVGIIHMGATIADRGFMYLVFFMGMISVNLAVINFLPMPIVDGGLFLFLVYEKIKGKQPSLIFQNVATIIGLFIIGTVFIITFYNDVTRLFS
ncbi:MAG TPA: site-2 protease family protein [Phycisphaerales bacterium]|nr:site-2 protease family protein [Phycisphaerales bacterium]